MRSETRFSPTVNVMVNAVKAAAKGLIRDFGELEHLQVSQKSVGDFVSAADLNAEKTLVEELKKVRPDYGFLLEESGEIKGRDKTHRWIIDPLDGTFNFLHGIPYFCISVGLEKTAPDGSTEIIAGVVYNPITDELFTGDKGKGAFLNNRRLRVSSRRKIEEAMILTGMFGDKDMKAELSAVLTQTRNICRYGAAALDLCYVAAGRADFFWEYGLKAWDYAAADVIIREAGGVITDRKGEKNYYHTNEICVGNPDIHRLLMPILQKASSQKAA